MTGSDDWDEPRASFDHVVESLDAVIHRHPSHTEARARRDSGTEGADDAPVVTALPDNVVDLRARRLATARSGGYPDDAA